MQIHVHAYAHLDKYLMKLTQSLKIKPNTPAAISINNSNARNIAY